MKQLLNTLYVQTQGTYVHLDHDTLRLEVERSTKFQMPLHHLGSIVVFGNVLVSPFLIHRCADDGRDLVWLSEYGRFRARLSGSTTGNVLLRRSQHAALDNADSTLLIARHVVAGKLQNARSVLMRAAREANDEGDRAALSKAAKVHADAIRGTEQAEDLEKLRGIEGYAAKAYFAAFTPMIRTNRTAFALTERSRRPPRDPINALLSFVYTLLVGECIAACEGVGLDPQMGFLHALRPGRPALALDLMEELRSPLADRLILTLINRGQIKPDDFIERPGGAIHLTEDARKALLNAYQKRKQEEVLHPVVGSKTPLGLIAHVQARLLARHLRGDLPTYQPFVQR
ncbi:type I-C CRISPR-associated endonuclease Cas1 [Oscillatoria sp. FACHB-1407]|uniref:type I-C CRISPR-associated endonuclease Cas1c n=1 Tax=Oscillatoria sp. FACHB-1407 TaxID=2692847 RepID=UPI001681FFFC|nr:type I-C CRISPR-associated endonuclease Cas1c [Oscillatoria sp. FACHB-1407]MBD2462275.1 type I-C CRISPR-associated endonuclease Cas1 [Oscillatoria sp. FACHB-1407]